MASPRRKRILRSLAKKRKDASALAAEEVRALLEKVPAVKEPLLVVAKEEVKAVQEVVLEKVEEVKEELLKGKRGRPAAKKEENLVQEEQVPSLSLTEKE